DRETAKEIIVPEKADPHAAAVFLAHPASSAGSLAIIWAAFLPLGEPLTQVGCNGPTDYTLVLHGDFFVDPGRNRPDFEIDPTVQIPRDETGLRRSWNHHLAQLAVLPQVLPALRHLAEEGFSQEEIQALTRALANAFDSCPELVTWRPALCRDY